jgi:hypothetical protein
MTIEEFKNLRVNDEFIYENPFTHTDNRYRVVLTNIAIDGIADIITAANLSFGTHSTFVPNHAYRLSLCPPDIDMMMIGEGDYET